LFYLIVNKKSKYSWNYERLCCIHINKDIKRAICIIFQNVSFLTWHFILSFLKWTHNPEGKEIHKLKSSYIYIFFWDVQNILYKKKNTKFLSSFLLRPYKVSDRTHGHLLKGKNILSLKLIYCCYLYTISYGKPTIAS
jgi:hypothetical protein